MNYLRKSVAKLIGYTPGEQPSDPCIIKLNTNENPYPPAPAVREAIAGFNADMLRLYPNPVSGEVRARIAAIHGCEVENIFVGNGSDEILALCTRAFVENDGSIGYLDPSYSLYPVLADIRDVEKRPVALDVDFEWSIPKDYQCNLFFLTNPNAPTGVQAPMDLVRTFCKCIDAVVVVDEAYVDFARDNCISLALEMSNVLVMRTLSKSFSLAGIRVGYVVGSKTLIEALFKIKDSYNLDRLSQVVALAALSDMDYMRSNASRIIATRERLSDALRKIGYEVFLSDSNFVWTKPARISADELFAILKKKGILVRHFPGERTGAYLRISVGTDIEIDRLLECVVLIHENKI